MKAKKIVHTLVWASCDQAETFEMREYSGKDFKILKHGEKNAFKYVHRLPEKQEAICLISTIVKDSLNCVRIIKSGLSSGKVIIINIFFEY